VWETTRDGVTGREEKRRTIQRNAYSGRNRTRDGLQSEPCERDEESGEREGEAIKERRNETNEEDL
jgi:hypothetical protein